MKDDRLYLIHILECIERIETYVASGGKPAFMASTLTQDAVLRNLQTLAVSTQRLSSALKEARTAVDWHGISGFRNVLVHDYLGLDLDAVWNIVEGDLPNLKCSIQAMMQELGGKR